VAASDVKAPGAAKGETVLVLEENPAVRKLAKAICAGLGPASGAAGRLGKG
jgi:hypothetical protein